MCDSFLPKSYEETRLNYSLDKWATQIPPSVNSTSFSWCIGSSVWVAPEYIQPHPDLSYLEKKSQSHYIQPLYPDFFLSWKNFSPTALNDKENPGVNSIAVHLLHSIAHIHKNKHFSQVILYFVKIEVFPYFLFIFFSSFLTFYSLLLSLMNLLNCLWISY